MEISREQLTNLVAAGIQAPSADNMQPWRFAIGEDSLTLLLDERHTGLFFDPDGVATEIGCGAVVENIRLAAGSEGFSMRLVRAGSSSAGQIANMKFSVSGTETEDKLSRYVMERGTDRGLYRRKQPLTNQQIEVLMSSQDQLPGHKLTFYNGQDRDRFIQVVYGADTLRFSHPEIHKDFHHVLRFGRTATESCDGLAQSTLGIESFLLPILRMLKPWGLTRVLNGIGLHHIMALRGVWLPMVSAPYLVSLVYVGEADYFESGRAMQRFWLAATSLGLSVQPLGAFPLFLARMDRLDGQGFNEKQKRKINTLRKEFISATPVMQSEPNQLVMLFRLGYPRKKAPPALRRPVESFIV